MSRIIGSWKNTTCTGASSRFSIVTVAGESEYSPALVRSKRTGNRTDS